MDDRAGEVGAARGGEVERDEAEHRRHRHERGEHEPPSREPASQRGEHRARGACAERDDGAYVGAQTAGPDDRRGHEAAEREHARHVPRRHSRERRAQAEQDLEREDDLELVPDAEEARAALRIRPGYRGADERRATREVHGVRAEDDRCRQRRRERPRQEPIGDGGKRDRAERESEHLRDPRRGDGGRDERYARHPQHGEEREPCRHPEPLAPARSPQRDAHQHERGGERPQRRGAPPEHHVEPRHAFAHVLRVAVAARLDDPALDLLRDPDAEVVEHGRRHVGGRHEPGPPRRRGVEDARAEARPEQAGGQQPRAPRWRCAHRVDEVAGLARGHDPVERLEPLRVGRETRHHHVGGTPEV